MNVKVSKLESFPPGNPFLYECDLMGHRIGKDLMMMYKNHEDDEMGFFILVDERSGERVKVEVEMGKVRVMECQNMICDGVVLSRRVFVRPVGHKCKVSTGICGRLTFGSGELSVNGYWERGCCECARAHEQQFPGEACWPSEEDK